MRARLWDKNFRYVPAAETDISKTFDRIRREQKRIAQEAAQKVAPLTRQIQGGRHGSR